MKYLHAPNPKNERADPSPFETLHNHHVAVIHINGAEPWPGTLEHVALPEPLGDASHATFSHLSARSVGEKLSVFPARSIMSRTTRGLPSMNMP